MEKRHPGINPFILIPIVKRGGGGGGTDDYNKLSNKPKIEGKVLTGDMSLRDIGDIPIADKDIVQAVHNAFTS